MSKILKLTSLSGRRVYVNFATVTYYCQSEKCTTLYFLDCDNYLEVTESAEWMTEQLQ